MSFETDHKLMERLKKLYTLSKRGVGGEASNAKNILDKQLQKYGISIESLMDIETKKYYFTPKKQNGTKNTFCNCFKSVGSFNRKLLFTKKIYQNVFFADIFQTSNQRGIK